jgi:hypothetical protein
MRRYAAVLVFLGACSTSEPRAETTYPFAHGDAPTVSFSEDHAGEISGQIEDIDRNEPANNAIIVLQAKAVGTLEVMTDEYGRYRFEGLPPDVYTVQALFGQADVSRVVPLAPDTTSRTNFSLKTVRRGCLVINLRPRMDESLFSIDRTEARLLDVPPTSYGR